MALQNALGDIALDASVQEVNTTIEALNALQGEIKALNDTMLVIFAAILEKMPRVTGNDQAAVSVEGAVTVAGSLTTVTNVTTLATATNLQQIGTKYVNGDNLNMGGVGHIYDNVKVS